MSRLIAPYRIQYRYKTKAGKHTRWFFHKPAHRPAGRWSMKFMANKEAEKLRTTNKYDRVRVVYTRQPVVTPARKRPVLSLKNLAADGAVTIDERHLAVTFGRNKMRGVVLHSTESSDIPGTADISGIAAYLRRKNYGVHYVSDGEGNVLIGGNNDDLMTHVAGANATHIGIEMVGHARWKTKDWLKFAAGGHRKQISAVARILAYVCVKENIPIEVNVLRGITTHGAISKHYGIKGGHWDPGFGFPLKTVVRMAKRIAETHNIK